MTSLSRMYCPSHLAVFFLGTSDLSMFTNLFLDFCGLNRSSYIQCNWKPLTGSFRFVLQRSVSLPTFRV